MKLLLILLSFFLWIPLVSSHKKFSPQEIEYVQKRQLVWRVEFIMPPSRCIKKEEYPLINGHHQKAYERLLALRAQSATIIYCGLEFLEAGPQSKSTASE